jgi:hypothetical protein
LKLPAEQSKTVLTAEPIAVISAPAVTAMDISPDGLRAVVSTYASAYQFVRSADEDWAVGFGHRPTSINLPTRRQGESLCFGADGKTLYLTSEGSPSPLWRVSPVQPTDK